MTETNDRPIPTQVKYGIGIAVIAYLIVFYVFGLISFIDFTPDGIALLGTTLLSVLAGVGFSFAAFNQFAESQLKFPKQTGSGIGYFLLYFALSYFIFIILYTIGIDPSWTYAFTLWTNILNMWTVAIINAVIGLVLVYVLW